MTRQVQLLSALLAVVVLGAWWMLLMAPRAEEVAALQLESEDTRSQQAVVQERIRALESIRTEAPDIEADLAAARALLPAQPGLPSAIRQLQDAADQSGLVLTSIAPTRPAPVADRPELASIAVAVSVEGGYYQWVDFLRRVEDPRLVGRGVLVDAVDLGVGEYPSLTGNVQMTMFATSGVSPLEVDDATAGVTGADETGADETSSDEPEGGDA